MGHDFGETSSFDYPMNTTSLILLPKSAEDLSLCGVLLLFFSPTRKDLGVPGECLMENEGQACSSNSLVFTRIPTDSGTPQKKIQQGFVPFILMSVSPSARAASSSKRV